MTKKLDNGIIPTINIEKTIEPVYNSIRKLYRKVDSINILNPLNVVKLQRINTQKKKLQLKYEKQIEECYSLLIEPVSGPAFSLGFTQSWSTAKGSSAILKLQNAWFELGAVLDRKYSYMLAILALYIAIISVLLTLGIGLYG